jgi:hypothetical protein
LQKYSSHLVDVVSHGITCTRVEDEPQESEEDSSPEGGEDVSLEILGERGNKESAPQSKSCPKLGISK